MMNDLYRFYDHTRRDGRQDRYYIGRYYIGVPMAWIKRKPHHRELFEHVRLLRHILADRCYYCGALNTEHLVAGRRKQCLFMPTVFKALPDLDNLLINSDVTPLTSDFSLIPYAAYRISVYWVGRQRALFDQYLDTGPVQL